ncbi:MAG: DNA-3-methyladenine glycosylase 2 family protein [Acidobacteria bacterium]|nr:MAG: DNA-3-methyladenine glycosylase 2 family protein [Acidobacteriota bacterium]
MSLDPYEIRRALRHLRTADPVMGDVIKKAGPFRLKLGRDRFHMLVASIISQQISGKAAASIRQKLAQYIAPEKISRESLARLSHEELRSVGLSPQKATYLLDLAERVANGSLRLDRMGRMPDEKIIEALVEVKGIGIWTAQMFLIFALGRLDVFPHADLGVRMAIRDLYGLQDLPDKDISHKIAAPWRPYASVATWYCWRSLEFEEN